jgi:hypothetical protein
MRKCIIVVITLVMFSVPSVCFGLGILQYAFDGIKNQLGLDRGPVSKVVPEDNPTDPYCRPNPLAGKLHPDRNRMVIQAEGF